MKRPLAWPLAVAVLAVGCGKKGPPLPPLVLLPGAPADLSIARRADEVIVRFKLPAANTDGSTPADLDRVDVYAFSGIDTAPAEVIFSRGTKVGSIIVNPPIDPDASQDEVDKAKAVAPEGGLDQGALASISDHLSAPLPAPDLAPRTYLAVGVSTRGRRGAMTRRIAVPSVGPPEAPALPTVEYDETSITATWPVVSGDGVLYRLYRTGDPEVAIGGAPVAENRATDGNPEWDTERCYVVRSVLIVADVSIESDASPSRCVTPKDTFPPKAPTGLQAVAADGAVNLIWDANSDPDLAGYVVLRAIAPETTPTAVGQSLVTETTVRDTVPSGARVIYAIQAVDKAGNRSPLSATVEETPR